LPSRLPARDAEGKRSYPTPTAPTLLETMWGRLDEITSELMRDYSGDPPENYQHGNGSDCISEDRAEWDRDLAAMKGEALGVAWCISVVESPYAPNVDTVRAEAMRRWRENRRG
jgi:hypothetical protein